MRDDKNIKILKDAVEGHTFIRHVSKHLNPDGSFDIDGSLKLWNHGMEPFEKIKLWEVTPGFDKAAPLQEEPYIVFVPAPKESEIKSTIIVAHGGGFMTRTGCEGVNVAWAFHKAGYNTAILNYRLLPYSRLDSMADMQRAIRFLRAHKEELGINDTIILMGFSAGAMLSGNCATHYDMGDKESVDTVERYSSKPDAVVMSYGAMSSVSFPVPFGMDPNTPDMFGRDAKEKYYLAPEKHITPNTPPMFIWQTLSDDGRHGMCLAKALQDAGVPYELHIFEGGVHGLALADGENDLAENVPHVNRWVELCLEWFELHQLDKTN